jgi:ABC-type proline/glycine betaine transport system ATPase subunit
MKGFDPAWCQWVQRYIKKKSVGIRVNVDICHYLQTKKGLRQGDPLFPILFNIVADMLAIMQYADDTILFMEHDLDKALNIKLLLCIFE